MTPSAIQRNKSFPIGGILRLVSFKCIIPAAINRTEGFGFRVDSFEFDAKEINIQSSILRGRRGSQGQIAQIAEVITWTSGDLKGLSCGVTVYINSGYMCSNVGLIFFDGDPVFVPFGWIKGNHVGTIPLSKVDVTRNLIAIEFVEAETIESSHQVIRVSTWGILVVGQGKSNGSAATLPDDKIAFASI